MSTEETSPKRPRLSDEVGPTPNESEIAVAGPSTESATPKIFDLTIDCFDEIFEYLDVEDLYSVGQTCKKLQRVAGEYFQQNFPASVKCFKETNDICLYSHRKNKCMEIPGFSQFVKHIEIDARIKPITIYQGRRMTIIIRSTQASQSNKFDQLQSIETQIDNSLIKSITFVEIDFRMVDIERIRNILGKVEAVEMQKCYFYGNSYDKLLKHCRNLKRLNIHYSHLRQTSSDNTDVDDITAHQYPLLEHLKLIPHDSITVNDLKGFFERHPSLRSFSTSSQRLFNLREQLFECTSELDVLKIKDDRRTTDFVTICNIIKKLHAQGFYKRLHFEGNCDEECTIELAALPGLEKLCVKRFIGIYRLPALVSLKQLAILKDANPTDMNELADCLHELRRVFLFKATLADALPFIRRSMNLTKLKIYPKDEASFENGILDLLMLEGERKKLVGARKVMIYVPDGMFLKTKWAIKDGNINLNLVEIQRYDLYSWGMAD